MNLLKFHHNCFGNWTTGYGVKDLDNSQLAAQKNKNRKWCSLMDMYMFWERRVLYGCVHKCVHIQFLHVCADSEARKIWYVRLTIEWHVWGLSGNSDKPVLWPLAFLCQNSTSEAQEQRIVGHGNVYLPCSHPDQQLCSSGPEKHWLCKLSLSHTHTHRLALFLFRSEKTETREHRDNGQDSVFCVRTHLAFTFMVPLHFMSRH